MFHTKYFPVEKTSDLLFSPEYNISRTCVLNTALKWKIIIPCSMTHVVYLQNLKTYMYVTIDTLKPILMKKINISGNYMNWFHMKLTSFSKISKICNSYLYTIFHTKCQCHPTHKLCCYTSTSYVATTNIPILYSQHHIVAYDLAILVISGDQQSLHDNIWYVCIIHRILRTAERQYYQDLIVKHKANIKNSWQVINSVINKRKYCPFNSTVNKLAMSLVMGK